MFFLSLGKKGRVLGLSPRAEDTLISTLPRRERVLALLPGAMPYCA
jgi:hypothetical protein